MKDVFFLYNQCCFYEIVILNYFMSVTGCDVVFCSLDGRSIKATEGYSVNIDAALNQIDKTQVRSFIIPGGDIASVDCEEVRSFLREMKKNNILIAGICNGADLLDRAGILDGISSTHSTDRDIVRDQDVITARANAYVDFAIETAKALDLFLDEADLQETIDFWKNHKRIQ